MALDALVTKRPAPTRIGPTMLLDALVRESHDRQAEVTEFPVETGANISDNIRNRPREVSIDGFISNNPVRFLGGIPKTLIRGTPGADDSVVGPNLNLIALAFAELERLYDARELIEVATPRRLYQNMAITRLNIPKDRSTGAALRFSVSFREVERVETRTVGRRFTRTTQERSQPKRDAGKKTPPPATAKAAEKVTNQSALFKLTPAPLRPPTP